jgi:hypothetical protein
MNFQSGSQHPFALVFDFSALLVDNLNWNSCITAWYVTNLTNQRVGFVIFTCAKILRINSCFLNLKIYSWIYSMYLYILLIFIHPCQFFQWQQFAHSSNVKHVSHDLVMSKMQEDVKPANVHVS